MALVMPTIVQQFVSDTTRWTAGIVGAQAILGTFRAAARDVGSVVDSMFEGGASIQRFQVVFGALLGDIRKGKQELESLQQMSLVTPFSVDKLAEASQILLGMGVAGEELNATMSRLGDLALGDVDR